MAELRSEVSRFELELASDESRDRYRAIFDSAVDFAFITTDRAGLVIDWNSGAEHIFGWTAVEMKGAPADRFFTPEDRKKDRVALEMHRALESGRAADDRWHLRQDGTQFWATGEMMPLRNLNGKHLGYLKIVRDRTEQRLASEAQRADAELLNSILRSSEDCIGVLNLDGHVLQMNQATQTALGITDLNTHAGRLWTELWQDGDVASVMAQIAAARAGDTGHFQRTSRSYQGVITWWDVKITPLRDSDGRPEKLLAISRDITERKRSEQTLTDLNDSLERRVEARTRERDRAWKFSRDLQLVIERNGIIRAANEAWNIILGWPVSEVIGRHYLDFIHPDDHGMSDEALLHAKTTDSPVYENRFRHREDGYRWISWIAAFEGDYIYASGRHITAEKEAALSLHEAQEQLRQSQKMEAVGQLTGGLAHDFNNLLAAILGSLELLQTRIAKGQVADVDRFIGAAQGAAKRAAGLTHRLLAFARRQTLDPKATDVTRLVGDMAEIIERTVGPEVELRIMPAPDAWTVLVDPNQLETALLNLCINARDAMPKGGSITIETANQEMDERSAAVRDMASGPYLSLCVTDTGTGMTRETIQRAFDPFFTTKPLGAGTGLGLSMVYGFARQSGGHVRIYSELNAGSTVCIYLPRHTGPKDVIEVLSPPSEIVRAAHPATVMVVDDEAAIRMLVIDVLDSFGYTATEAEDAAGALERLRAGSRPDLLITDVGLPGGMNGRQLADAARELYPHLNVLFITGYAEHAVLNSEQLGRGMRVLTKPFSVEALASRIDELIVKP